MLLMLMTIGGFVVAIILLAASLISKGMASEIHARGGCRLGGFLHSNADRVFDGEH